MRQRAAVRHGKRLEEVRKWNRERRAEAQEKYEAALASAKRWNEEARRQSEEATWLKANKEALLAVARELDEVSEDPRYSEGKVPHSVLSRAIRAGCRVFHWPSLAPNRSS